MSRFLKATSKAAFPLIHQPVSRSSDKVASQPVASATASHSRWSCELPDRKLAIGIVMVSIVALGITGYLGGIALNSSKIAGCSGGSIFDCNDVINSRWSRWIGIPVSFLAFGMYATLFASVIIGSVIQVSDRTRQIAWSLVVVMGLSAGWAAIWFTSLQIFVLKHLCTYCLAAHSCGLVIAGLLLWNRPLGGHAIKSLSIASFFSLGLLVSGQLMFKPVTYKVIEHQVPAGETIEAETFEFSVPAGSEGTEKRTSATASNQSLRVAEAFDWWQGILILMQPERILQSQVSIITVQDQGAKPQSSSKENATTNQSESNTIITTETTPKNRRFVLMSGGTLKLDVAQWPLVGRQDAKYVFVEMFDYTCDHCRRTHAAIAAAKAKLDGDVAILTLPIPLNTNCNSAITMTGPRMAEACEISKLAIALWRVDASKFEVFHNYLMTTPNIVTYGEATARANVLVEVEKLKAVLASDVPRQYIAQHVELYKRVGTGKVPKLLFPGTSIVGEFTSADALVDVIKTQLKSVVPNTMDSYR
jgi:uncharacterized membrane protein